MRHEQAIELLPLYALHALDDGEAAGVAEHARSCFRCACEAHAWDGVAGEIGTLAPRVAPPAPLRSRVMRAVGPVRPRAAWFAVAASLAAAAAAGGFAWRAERRLQALSDAYATASAVGDLAARPTARFARLQALPPAPGASGRVLFEDRTAVLVVSGLAGLEPGRAYQLWVIAEGAPVPAGVFRTDAVGRAVLRVPVLDATARVKTFAVTIEPEQGSPAPTGAMVLAGSV